MSSVPNLSLAEIERLIDNDRSRRILAGRYDATGEPPEVAQMLRELMQAEDELRRAQALNNTEMQKLLSKRAREIQEAVVAKKAQRSGQARMPGVDLDRRYTTKSWNGVQKMKMEEVARMLDAMPTHPPSTPEGAQVEVKSGFTRSMGGVRQVWCDGVHVRAIFKDVDWVAGRDAVQGMYNGRLYETDFYTANHGGWWSEVSGSAPVPSPSENPMKKFSERVLAQGQFDELEKVQTPKPGEQFDMNHLAVSCVLALNKAVEVIAALEKRVTELEAREIVERVEKPANAVEPAFQLTKLGDSYRDVKKAS